MPGRPTPPPLLAGRSETACHACPLLRPSPRPHPLPCTASVHYFHPTACPPACPQVTGYVLVHSQNRVRQRTYVVGHHVRPGFRFVPIVKHPAQTRWAGGPGRPALLGQALLGSRSGRRAWGSQGSGQVVAGQGGKAWVQSAHAWRGRAATAQGWGW